MTATLPRRAWLSHSALTAMTAALTSGPSWAKSRPIYGGTLISSLPLDFSAIDPHDPESLTASLLGHSLFEPLYSVGAAARVYPTLATGLPFLRSARSVIPLRPRMRFSDGSRLDAEAVRQSLLRSREKALDGDALPIPRVTGELELSFEGVEPNALATQLCQLSHAVVPQRFVPTSIVTSGALRRDEQGEGRLGLSHNPLCPRGGSFLEKVELKSRSVATTLRDFESRASDLALLGRGLHTPRHDSLPFELDDNALVVVIASASVRSELRPGALQSLVEGLARGPLEALCVYGERSSRQRWFAAPTDLWVVESDPWLVATAEAIARSWSTERSAVTVRRANGSEWRRRRATPDFGLALTFLRTEAGANAVTRRLFLLDEKLPPRSSMSSPSQAARQLHSAIVGVVRPRGGVGLDWKATTGKGRLTLSTAQLAARSR